MWADNFMFNLVKLKELLQPLKSEMMESRKVSKAVNEVRNNSFDLLRMID